MFSRSFFYLPDFASVSWHYLVFIAFPTLPPYLVGYKLFVPMAASSTQASPAADAGGRSYPVLSRREIEALIADGRAVFVLDQHVVKADAWRKYHPGGDKAIMHMVGRDATDEVTGWVSSSFFTRGGGC